MKRAWVVNAAVCALVACGGQHWGEPAPIPQREHVRGQIAVVTYNVHALPSLIAGDDPPGRLPLIAALLRSYDIAFVQELWMYHDHLTKSLSGWTVIDGPGIRSGLDAIAHPFATGLVLGSRLPVSVPPPSRYGQYDICAGRWTHDNDCWARKGWLSATLDVDGDSVDVYTSHLDSGIWPEDRAARGRQLDSLAAAVERDSSGRPVIIAGDLNLDVGTPDDMVILRRFATRLRLTESGARPDSTQWPERLDWILFRSGKRSKLTLKDAGVDSRFERGGRPLSDHAAIYAILLIDR
jgi:endonuclease/exonuclease/phosphatase family metal-dependent hydrolase